jgi:hypothetical protein
VCWEGGVAAAVTFGEFRLLIEGVEKRRRKRYVWKDREENCKALYRSGARSMPASLLTLSPFFFHTVSYFPRSFPIPYCIFLYVSFVTLSSIFASVS